ncbi:FcoT family thioesterase [Mycolicibacterium fallax]|jgi:hypothetical protein|uniref:(2E)-enoyl-[ACP] glycyltransferase n=1 Tax=Mycolicibacterium fallax TaxID=1793 RepID=A0A1X1R926_MYCFA|nr:FcoT family thioesterase [Mycolicibacterium fallax]ORV01633.1 hypothetical protein AWC04_13735 [Mycolicibacterium fallax]BBY98957.1 hypothetical protein MFAL_24240 [Mycolicibacterium fallax]HOW95401.1 FcoT family thioesterase [Mycolicibacterium fallax]
MTTTELSPAAQAHLNTSDIAPITEDLLTRVLEPYSHKGCRYLRTASYKATETSMFSLGTFAIAESSYIRSTGHFNAAEMMVCFNQIAYSAFAPAILNEQIPPFRGWSIEDYFDHQLPSMLIKNFSARFSRPINAAGFSARLWCEDFEVVDRTWRYLRIPCTIEFWDADGGFASGEVELAALNIP